MEESFQRDSDDGLLRLALQNQVARDRLRQKLQMYLTGVVERFMESHSIDYSRHDELIRACMQPYDEVFSIFMRNPENLDKSTEYFFQYYTWWARQIMTRHL